MLSHSSESLFILMLLIFKLGFVVVVGGYLNRPHACCGMMAFTAHFFRMAEQPHSVLFTH